MPFSTTVQAQRQSAWFKLLQATAADRRTLRTHFTRYLAALHAAEGTFNTATEDERNAAIAAQAAAHVLFQKTVTAGSENYEVLMATLPDTDEAARKEATTAYHNILRDANSVYDRAVGPTAVVLKAIEARAMVPYEAAARLAFETFGNEVKAIIEPTQNRSTCHAGSDRFVLQEEGRKR